MASVRIVTDSSCDLTAEQTAAHDIEVVPLSIRFGAEEFVDRVELSSAEFYAKMAASEQLPETAAPAPGAFAEAYRKAAADGAAVLCITISSDLSATYQSAVAGAQLVEGEVQVQVVDSHSITLGLGAVAVAAAKAGAAGASLEEVAALAVDLSRRTHVLGTLDTLDNLKKGGRIGGAQALVGSLLSIKPIVDISTGKVEEAGKARTRRKALAAVAERVLAQPSVEGLCVMHGEAPDLEDFIALLAPKYSRDDIELIATIGPVIGTHGGPRVIGCTWQDPA